jgi:cellulose synthase/poly-beta-1,6-N-acetylglucosamine synthase-like glycosyltransferase
MDECLLFYYCAMAEPFHIWIYVAPLICMLIYWIKSHRSLQTLRQLVPSPNEIPKTYSKKILVIVPFCDEVLHLPHLLHDLAQLDTSHLDVRIVLVNDHSRDRGDVYATEHNPLPDLIEVTHSTALPGKKNAILFALKHAVCDVFCTLDADARVPSSWLRSMVANYHYSEPAMVIGQVTMRQTPLWIGRFQFTEWLLMQGLTIASAEKFKAVLCNGASLLIERRSFEESGGYARHLSTASGDDMYTMLTLKRYGEGAIKMQNEANSAVEIQPITTWKGLWKQRVRWASKKNLVRDKDVLLTGVTIVLGNMSLLWCALCSPVVPFTSHLFFLLLGIKCIADYGVADHIAKQRKQTFQEVDLIVLNLIYPLYLVSVWIGARCYTPIWKHPKSGNTHRAV